MNKREKEGTSVFPLQLPQHSDLQVDASACEKGMESKNAAFI
jgi:hypothetical protein